MLKTEGPENAYLGEVLERQAAVDRELRCQQQLALPPSAARAGMAGYDLQASLPTGRAIEYRVTGFWRWRTVVVPPNVYVVHGRRGYPEPLHMGLGISFKFDPSTDSFLLIPAAVQTIVINAKCICIERQGILVQAYVQWIIDDLNIAYRRLDFSPPEDPMRIVNVQLREQAEAAIKDKVATMSIDDVLSDKQPIIEELTHRLRLVAEGSREGPDASGLGLKIVTVQIKEAVVSSTRLWENLQKPFRAEREKLARLAELETHQQIAARELQSRQARQTAELETERVLNERRDANAQEIYNREQAEKARRHKLEQDAERQSIIERNTTAMARKQAELELALQELELARQRVDQEIETLRRQTQLEEVRAEEEKRKTAADNAVKDVRFQGQAARTERRLGLRKTQRDIDNALSEGNIKTQLIAKLPEIAAMLPKPEELRTVQISADGQGGTTNSLLGFVAGALSLAETVLKGGNHTGTPQP